MAPVDEKRLAYKGRRCGHVAARGQSIQLLKTFVRAPGAMLWLVQERKAIGSEEAPKDPCIVHWANKPPFCKPQPAATPVQQCHGTVISFPDTELVGRTAGRLQQRSSERRCANADSALRGFKRTSAVKRGNYSSGQFGCVCVCLSVCLSACGLREAELDMESRQSLQLWFMLALMVVAASVGFGKGRRNW